MQCRSELGYRAAIATGLDRAAVGINSANGWYPAGLDLCLCLPCGHAEPSEALLQGLSPLIAPGQPEGLKALARQYSRVSGVDGGGVWGRFVAVSIRKRGSEISIGISPKNYLYNYFKFTA